jgi:hypothetical protein
LRHAPGPGLKMLFIRVATEQFRNLQKGGEGL